MIRLLALGLFLCLLTACDSGRTPADTTAEITPASTDPVTEPPTEAPAEAPTEEETTEEVTTEPETELKGWEQDTGKFNDGVEITTVPPTAICTTASTIRRSGRTASSTGTVCPCFSPRTSVPRASP